MFNFVTLDVNQQVTVITFYSFMVFGNRIQADSTWKCSWHLLFYSNLQFSQECLVVWLEKRKKSLEGNFGKDLVELIVPSRKYLPFFCYVYRKMCTKRDLEAAEKLSPTLLSPVKTNLTLFRKCVSIRATVQLINHIIRTI